MAEKYDFLFKCTILGDGGTGKTAIVVRFSQGFFKENYKMTIGVEFAVKSITVKGSQEHDYNVKLQVWDVGGQDRFQYVRPLYYKGAMGCIILYDVTNRESFDHIPRWIEEIRKEVGEIPTLMVGNKCDLNEQRVVSRKEAEKFAKKLKFLYAESSAKSGSGVGDIFKILALMMIGEEVPKALIQENLADTLVEALGEPADLIKENVESLSGSETKPRIFSTPQPAPLSIKATSSVESKPQFQPSPLQPSITQNRPTSNPFIQKSSRDASPTPISKEKTYAPPTPPNPFKSQSLQPSPEISSQPKKSSTSSSSKSFTARKSFSSSISTDSNLYTPETPPKPLKEEQSSDVQLEAPQAETKSSIPFATVNSLSEKSDLISEAESILSQQPAYFAPETPKNPFLESKPSEKVNPKDEPSKMEPIKDSSASSYTPFIQQTPVKSSSTAPSSSNNSKSFVPFIQGHGKEESPKPFTQRDPEEIAADEFSKKRELVESNLQLNVKSKTFVGSANPFLTPSQSNIPPIPKRTLSDNLLQKQEPTTPKQYVCHKCGNIMTRKFKYCNKCGAVVK
ncbi:MAG: GTP-binding protein [Promethearchaeota archaeon]